jgi:hypothetical protein
MNTKGFFVGVLVLFSTTVFATDEKTSAEFTKLDASGDGSISVMEAQGHIDLLRKWVDVDKNADGALDISEFSAFESQEAYVPNEDDDRPDLGAAPTPE